MVQDLLHSIRKQYRNVTEGKEVELVLDEHNLPLISKGGVILYDQLNRMVVTNTLSARLDLVAHKLLPEIRNALWSNKPFKIMEYMDLT
ncbi:V-type proton ATPase subunit E-like [Chrysoperla carnea]|uniref:V-type proton ATPase subunit E-like n=1 Tax=Chrysoperla carnea TaxID=189513 RepID=UPI001D08C31E|nr:V-type proton ATPase subunit E-like [Chrysoperla carnea]